MRHRVLLFLALLCQGLFAGIVFGWGGLQLLLETDGVYEELCDSGSETSGSGSDSGRADGQCEDRTARFSLIYTLGFTTSVWGSLPAGALVDRSGSQASLVVSALLLGSGMLMLGVADSEELDIFVPG